MNEPEVLTVRRGRLGLITLNRPKAINALTHGMVGVITRTLARWRDDSSIAAVAVTGAGDRGLCAGGDVVSLYNNVTMSDGMAAAAFWRDEYAMNAIIAAYPKPYIAIQDGVVLGGGVGVSAHGSHRIVTERTKIGFPETTIGYIPDVGGTWLLSHAPGELGTRLALSSENVGAADAILLGLADHFVPSEKLPQLMAALEMSDATAAIAAVAEEPPAGMLAEQRQWVDGAFGAVDVATILAELRWFDTDEATKLADTISAKSPIALSATLASLRRAAALPDLEAALQQEYRVSRHSSTTHDFAEGIRAQIVDKDRDPKWNPAALADVTSADVEAFFAAPPEGDIRFRLPSKEMP